MWSNPEAFPKYSLAWIFQYAEEFSPALDCASGGVRVSEVYPVRISGNGGRGMPVWGRTEAVPMGMAYQLGNCYVGVGDDELLLGMVSPVSDPESPTRWSIEVSSDELITVEVGDSERMVGVVCRYSRQGRLMDLQIDATFPRLGWQVEVYGNDFGLGQVGIEGAMENIVSEVEAYGEEGPAEEAFDREDFEVVNHGWKAKLTGELGMKVLMSPRGSRLMVGVYHHDQLCGKLWLPLVLADVDQLWQDIAQVREYPGESIEMVPQMIEAVRPRFHASWKAVNPGNDARGI